ncbi:MAG: transglutaminase-like domain-containing protein, partial [Candidatus Altiarchaeota archaeon]|nr:transglutaminase-like domain-containing protein [Candidatus Altiarchaeota archaeon]
KEEFMPSEGEVRDIIYVSQETDFDNWQELNRRVYNVSYNETLIHGLSDSVVGNLTGKKAIIALYDWVRLNVNYDDTDLLTLTRAYTPRPPEEVLLTRKGDCKDLSLLLTLLLKSAGFHAEPTSAASSSPTQHFGAFNHIIVKVKYGEEIIFLDPSCSTCPYNVFTPNIYGKYVLGFDSTEFDFIPMPEKPYYDDKLTTTFNLSKIEPAIITFEHEYNGLRLAEVQRQYLKKMSEKELGEFFEDSITASCPRHKTKKIQVEGLNDSLKPLIIRWEYECPGVALIEPSILSMTLSSTQDIPSFLLPEKRLNDMVKEGDEKTTNEVIIIFPPDYEITSEHSGYSYTDEDFYFIKNVTKKGNILYITHEQFLRPTIPKEKYDKLKQYYLKQREPQQTVTAKKADKTSSLMIIPLLILILAGIYILSKRKTDQHH